MDNSAQKPSIEPVVPAEQIPAPPVSESTNTVPEAPQPTPAQTTPIEGQPEVPSMPAPVQPVQSTPMGTDNSGKKSSSLMIIAGLVALLVIGLLAAFYFFNMQLKKQTAQKTVVGPTAMPITPIKTLVIGTDGTYPPMEFLNTKKILVGYDIDLGNQIAGELGGRAIFKNIPWDNVFQALEKKQVDIIISSVTITDERQKQYLFTTPYINAGQVILTKKTEKNIVGTADLKGKKVGVQKDTTSEKEAKKYTDPGLITTYADYGEAAKSLVSGKLDAVIIDLTAGKGLVDTYPTLKIASDPFTNEYYGIVLRKDDTVMQKRLNQAISSLHERGILDDIKQKWFQ